LEKGGEICRGMFPMILLTVCDKGGFIIQILYWELSIASGIFDTHDVEEVGTTSIFRCLDVIILREFLFKLF
jgi:hypothetical protein